MIFIFVLVFVCGIGLGIVISPRGKKADVVRTVEFVPVGRFRVETGDTAQTFTSASEAAIVIGSLRENKASYRYYMDGKLVREV
jgi:hypothetical protein